MKRLSFLFIGFGISILSYSQCDSTQWAQAGTYEVIKIEKSSEADLSDRPFFLTEDHLCQIESSRHDNQFVIIELNADYRVKIYPRIVTTYQIER